MTKGIRYLPLKERERLYKEALGLRKKHGWGYVRIGRAIGVHYDVVRHWIHHGRNPSRHGRMHMFESKPSPELAYIIGVCQGDADLPSAGKSRYRKGQKIRLRVIDKDFVERFAENVALVLGKETPFTIGVERESYRVVINSYHLHQFLKKPLEDMKNYIENYPSEFIKGVVDSEGSVNVGIARWKGWEWLDVKVRVSSSNYGLLLILKGFLRDHFGINSHIRKSYNAGSFLSIKGKEYRRRKDAFDLSFGKIDDLKKYSDLIGFSIKRKQTKLLDIIEIFDRHGNGKGRVDAWLNLYYKANNRWKRKYL